ncbi:MAG TPA: CHAT domain-containing protein, partial [Terriglobales bacterium]
MIDRETTENVPLRVLFVLANPLGLPRCFDTVRTWEEITDALTSVAGGGSLVFERLGHPTEAGLKEALANTAWNVVHFVAHAQEQALVHHGTIVLQRLDGSARHMTAEPLAGRMAPSDSIRLVVLQPCDENSHPATLAESL